VGNRFPSLVGTLAFAGVTMLACSAAARGETTWSEVFNPVQVTRLHLTIDPSDWAKIRGDESLSIELPALFQAEGDEPRSVMVRRKSGTPIGDKVSLKIDINDLVSGQKWADLTKLSLENGDDAGVVSEGLAWYMHRQAAAWIDNLYTPSVASWAHVTVNGQPIGLYANVEQPNKQFLRNRDLYRNDHTWLYKQGEIGPPELRVGDSNSPTFLALYYPPFAGSGTTPSADVLTTELPYHIDMQGMLALGAVNALLTNPDELFNKGKNFFYADFDDGPRRYLPWDLDAVIRRTDGNIYLVPRGNPNQPPSQHPYQQVILNHPIFRFQFNQMMLDLLDGPLSVANLHAFLNDLEPVLTPWLLADTNSNIGSDVAGHFASLRQWVVARSQNVRQQVLADMALSAVVAGDVNRDNRVDRRDAVQMLAHWNADRSAWPHGDVSGDGLVSLRDLSIVQRQQMLVSASSSTAAVPEPAGGLLAVLGLLLVWRCRRRL
jgi:hypothetical protein